MEKDRIFHPVRQFVRGGEPQWRGAIVHVIPPTIADDGWCPGAHAVITHNADFLKAIPADETFSLAVREPPLPVRHDFGTVSGYAKEVPGSIVCSKQAVIIDIATCLLRFVEKVPCPGKFRNERSGFQRNLSRNRRSIVPLPLTAHEGR